jgi:uncharacterized protein YndB with AHSA1/START domain
VENREHLGKPALVAVAARSYDTTVEDLWDALTTPERLVRWFLPVEGDLRQGGRYRLEGNASGTIERCVPPHALDLTWEVREATSWVSVRLAADGQGARLTLEHIAHREAVGEEFLAQFGPGAVGVGWDLALRALELHLADPESALDPAEANAWVQSSEGKAFVRASGEAWGTAHAEAGEDPAESQAKAERTIAFYTGG